MATINISTFVCHTVVHKSWWILMSYKLIQQNSVIHIHTLLCTGNALGLS